MNDVGGVLNMAGVATSYPAVNGGNGGHDAGSDGDGNGDSATERPNDISAFLQAYPSIMTIAFIGSKAHATFARHNSQLTNGNGMTMRLVVLPSSSRANAQPLAQKAVEWRRVLLSDPELLQEQSMAR